MENNKKQSVSRRNLIKTKDPGSSAMLSGSFINRASAKGWPENNIASPPARLTAIKIKAVVTAINKYRPEFCVGHMAMIKNIHKILEAVRELN